MERLQTLSGHFAPNPTASKKYTFESVGNLKGKTMVVTGGSRGIGLAIAKRAAKDGANVAILAKTTTEDPRLPGTIFSAAKEIEELGGKALPIQCDIRDEKKVKEAIEKVVATFGGIDILVNNASAINLVGTLDVDMKRYDLMHSINTRGTFMVSKYCIPHLLKAKNPHILNLSPPLTMTPRWFANHCAYTMAKYGMSMCVLGMSEEFRDQGIAVNGLWPKTAIATAAVKNLLGGDNMIRKSRTEEILSDTAYIILTNCSRKLTGNLFIDEDILKSVGVTDFSKYKVDPSVKEEELFLDFFLE
jgi:citronellol/citronellal dehydrogenase